MQHHRIEKGFSLLETLFSISFCGVILTTAAQTLTLQLWQLSAIRADYEALRQKSDRAISDLTSSDCSRSHADGVTFMQCSGPGKSDSRLTLILSQEDP